MRAIGLVVAALPAVLLVAACGGTDVAPPTATVRDPLSIKAQTGLAVRLKTGSAEVSQVQEALRVPGRIEADETRLARVGAPVPGRVTDLEGREGDVVNRGQVLAVINSAELSTAQLGYLKALSQRGLASRAALRAQQLLDADVIGSAELQRRQAELAQAEAEVNAALDQLKVLGMSAVALERLTTTQMINSTAQIVSPIHGTIIDRKVTEGQVVQPADGVFLVADLSRLWAVADVPEQIAGRLRVGESVQLEIAALPGHPVAGKLDYVAPTVSPETRTVRVRMSLPNPAREFRPNMLASMVIHGAPQRRLTVPAEAVVREEDRDFVFVPTGDDSYRLRPVQLGAELNGRRIVLSGLREADKILVEGAFHLNNERKLHELAGS